MCAFPLAEERKKGEMFFLTRGSESEYKRVGAFQVTWLV